MKPGALIDGILLLSLPVVVTIAIFTLYNSSKEPQHDPVAAVSAPVPEAGSAGDYTAADPDTTLTNSQRRDRAVVEWAERLGVDPALALAVSYTENWSGDPTAWSRTKCCVGIMQINVRVWYGTFHVPCGGSDLLSFSDNACYGVAILKYYLDQCADRPTPDRVVGCALQRYGGWPTAARATPYIERVMEAL